MASGPIVQFETFPPLREPNCPFDPPRELQRRQRDQPISKIRTWDGTIAWLVTRYEDGLKVLSDDRFSADPRRPGFPEKSIAFAKTIGNDRNIRTIDNPEHDRQKRMMVRDFTVKRVEEIRPHVEALTLTLLDKMARTGPPADLVSSLAVPIPMMVICELLGVPYEERDFFADRGKALFAAPTAEEASAAGEDLNAFIERMIDLKMVSPANDLISRMVHEQVIPGHFSRDDLVSLGRLLLVAGHETTAGMIALSTLALLMHPQAAAELRAAENQKFIVNAVDELLRYLSIIHSGRRRVAIVDIEIGGQMIRADEGVIVMNNLMDRDDAVFPDAARLDLHRENARANVAFGYGIHQCPGQMLARMELRVVHSVLWKRFPKLGLAVPIEQLRFLESGPNFGVVSLPLTW